MNLSPSRLGNCNSSLIFDASVVLNLLGTGDPHLFLKTLGRSCIIDEVAISEVNVDPISGTSCEGLLRSLQSQGLLQVVRLGHKAYEHFISLTGAPSPDDLDDGEAATIAQAAFNGWAAVLDERKATRIAMTCLSKAQVLTSVDLFSSPELSSALGGEKVADLLYLALRNARMRVPSAMKPWVIRTLGDMRVAECPSLGLVKTTKRAMGAT